MSAIPDEETYVEAEIIEDDFKAPILRDIVYPVSIEALESLVAQYVNIPNIDLEADDEEVAKNYKFVRDGHILFAKERNKIEKTRKAIKDPALTFGKNVDAYAKKLQAIIKDTEDKLKLLRDRVEQNEARKQHEAEEAEEMRISKIKDKIQEIKNLPLQHFGSASNALTVALESLVAINKETYEEFYDEAVENQNDVITKLQQARENAYTVENAQKIQEAADKKALEAKQIEDEKLQADKDILAKEQAEFQKQKDDFAEEQRLIQEEADLKQAEREADELLKKQEDEKIERLKQDEELFEKNYNETWDDLKDSENKDEALLDLIINGKIRNIKWSPDAN